MQTAKTILNQLGGNLFIAMTGAKHFMAGENFIQFKIGGGAKNKINTVKVSLDADDTYTVEFYSICGINARKISESRGIYCDMLRSEFTNATGFYTSI